MLAAYNCYQYGIKNRLNGEQERAFHGIQQFDAPGKQNIGHPVLKDRQYQKPENIVEIKYQIVCEQKWQTDDKAHGIADNTAVNRIAAGAVHNDNLGGKGKTGSQGDDISQNMGKVQSIRKGKNAAGEDTEGQDDLISKGPLLPEHDRMKKYPDRSHVLQNNGGACGRQLYGDDIQNSGYAPHQGSQQIRPGEPQPEAPLHAKQHKERHNAPEGNDGHRSPGDGLHAHPGESPEQSSAYNNDATCGLFVFLISSHGGMVAHLKGFFNLCGTGAVSQPT